MIVVAVLGVALLLPSVVRLDNALPSVAAAIWLSALLLRALFVTLASVSLLALLPGTGAFYKLSEWCWNTTLPLVGSHLGLSGARLVQAVIILPLLLLLAWGTLRIAQIAKSHRVVRQRLEANSLGAGPAGSVIVGGSSVVMAAAGLVRPEVVLSAGALARLDDDELAAGIAHEQGHIARHHRWWIAVAEVSGSVARVLPGTKHALRQFKFHIERDADRWAVERTRNPLALASAICKSAAFSGGRAVFALTGAGAVDRVDQLIAAAPERRMAAPAQKFAASVAAVLVFASIALASTVPPATAAGVKHLEAHAPPIHCPI